MVRKEVLEELVLNTVMEELNAPETKNNIVSGLLQLQNQNKSRAFPFAQRTAADGNGIKQPCCRHRAWYSVQYDQ